MKSLDETRLDNYFARVDAGELIYTCNHKMIETVYHGALVGCRRCKAELAESKIDYPQPEKIIKPSPNGKTKRNRVLYRQLYLDDPPLNRKEAAAYHGLSYERIKQLDNRFYRAVMLYLHKRELERERKARFREKFGDDNG